MKKLDFLSFCLHMCKNFCTFARLLRNCAHCRTVVDKEARIFKNYD